ncbi:hypothetical protein LLE49_01615 [Alicyclobacillus tolerans]|uniref:hypothetical protein n=1 Tax=Alicyclobacillus tolerans TaxID=90970 RepID=UPI001F31EAF1|nr:hypothetical protein [Alicyclobacillus tolerans]MCF8563442.1 hypothetical protein [Alicyclobacillus tolerans]
MQEHREIAEMAEGPARVSGQIVHFKLVKFVEMNRDHREVEENPDLGYLVFNDFCREFGRRAFVDSDSYTFESDVIDHIEAHHPNLMPFVLQTKGLYIDGSWVEIEGDRNTGGEAPVVH